MTYCTASIPNRRRGLGSNKREISIEYYIRKFNKNLIRVCQKTFCNILRVKRDRVVRVVRVHLETGCAPIENRGGDRALVKNQMKKEAVLNFIKKFHTIETHYCRSKISNRQYLPGELNITQMHKMLLEESESNKDVKLCYFRGIFNGNFNIGFKTPASDLCSQCISLTERLKVERNPQKRQSLMVEQVIHKRRAKAFFQLLKEECDDLITISFDCQKNMVLPKIADSAAYYSRQLYMYNFGVVIGSSHSALTKENVFLYPWTEDKYPKGSSQIASAMYHCLKHLNTEGKTRIRLFADGCGGQNKNTIMISMVSFWFQKDAPLHITNVEVIFPIVGHSYIPPDRVFAKIEKEVLLY